ncbi:MAG: DnaD domain protein [Clostridia bacterium]|nr:DnaD domain protein [Clostridia bacterium]
MPFISVSDGLIKKSITAVENKFITKYLPELDPKAVKVYLYSLYVFQSGTAYTLDDIASVLNVSADELKNYYEYLEEFELVQITSLTPFEVKILEAENVSGTPKKIKPEKYSDFTKTVQSILTGRMISANEFMEYFYLLEEYGFEQDALIMIINYCVSLHGDNIRLQYIKKVAKSFADDGAVTAKKVEERLSAYTSSTPALLEIFRAAGIKKQPDVDDDKLYKKWTESLGFDDKAICVAAKLFKAKATDKIDLALEELFKNKAFDVKEIENYCANKNSVYAVTVDIAKNLGVYVQNCAPYVETYVSKWCNRGFSFICLKNVSSYLFRQSKNSFEDMDLFLQKLYDGGIIDDKSVNAHIEKRVTEDKLLREILDKCGLKRKIVPWDRENLAKWRSWGFGDEMLFEAARLAADKSNPMAYVNGILSGWKAEDIFTIDKISKGVPSYTAKQNSVDERAVRGEVERHYYDLRHAAEERAEAALSRATSDKIYGEIRKELNALSIELAFAEIRDKHKAAEISERMIELEDESEKRLSELCIDKDEFVPHYSCEICNDTGYDKNGAPCICLKNFLKTLKY